MRLRLIILLVPCLLLAGFAVSSATGSPPEPTVQAASTHDIQRFTLLADLVAEEQAEARRIQAEVARFEAQAQVERERRERQAAEAEAARVAAEEAHAAWHREQDRIAAEKAAQAASAPRGSNYARFEALAQCESNGNWSINTGNGYYGGLQFLASTWRAAGGTKYASLPHQATKDQQIAVAEAWLARTSWAQWPACSRKLGYR